MDKKSIKSFKYDDLEKEVILGRDNTVLKEEVASVYRERQKEQEEIEQRESKHKEERQKLDSEFNKLERKEDKIELYTKNIKIIFKDLNINSKFEIERMYMNEKFELNINKYLFLLFLNIYYKINKNLSYPRSSEIGNNLIYIKKDYF